MGEDERKIRVCVGVVVFRGEDALLIKRGRTPLVGQWSIPGGGLHYGERLEDAARREVMEETGLAIRMGGLIGVFEAVPGEHPDPAFDRHFVLVDFWAERVSGEPLAGDDATEAAFFPLDEALAKVSWGETRRAIASAAKLRNIANNRP